MQDIARSASNTLRRRGRAARLAALATGMLQHTHLDLEDISAAPSTFLFTGTSSTCKAVSSAIASGSSLSAHVNGASYFPPTSPI